MKHKHAEFIHLMANGVRIERKQPSGWVKADLCCFDWADVEFRIAELEAEVMEFKSRGNVAMSSWDEERERALREGERVVALEADVKDLHADIERLTTEAYTREAELKAWWQYADRIQQLRRVKFIATDAAREGK